MKNLAMGRGLVNGSRGVVVRFTGSGFAGLPVVRFTSGLEEVIRWVTGSCEGFVLAIEIDRII